MPTRPSQNFLGGGKWRDPRQPQRSEPEVREHGKRENRSQHRHFRACRLRTKASYAEICEAIRDAAAGAYRGNLQYCDEPVVSTDLQGNPHSAIFDVKAGMQTSEGLTKLIAWYDNEWGYSSRGLDLAAHIMRKG